MTYMTEKPGYKDWYFGGVENFTRLRQHAIGNLSSSQETLLRGWLEIAHGTPILSHAFNPPLTEASIMFYQDCHSLVSALTKVQAPPIGSGFATQNLCLFYLGMPEFGGEWLPIIGDRPAATFVARLPRQSDEECSARLIDLISELLALPEGYPRQACHS